MTSRAEFVHKIQSMQNVRRVFLGDVAGDIISKVLKSCAFVFRNIEPHFTLES